MIILRSLVRKTSTDTKLRILRIVCRDHETKGINSYCYVTSVKRLLYCTDTNLRLPTFWVEDPSKSPKFEESEITTMASAEKSVDKNMEKPLSNRARKRMKRIERSKQLRKLQKGFTKDTDPEFDKTIYECTDYYYENGLRKVYPYPFDFTTYVKERWFGRKILDVFAKEFQSEQPEHYKHAIETGNLTVNGKRVTCDFILGQNQFMAHHMHRHENPVTDTPFEIIADNSEVLVINKPSSIPCHPCGRYRYNTVNFILAKEYGYTNLRSFYRLDRLTSGLLIMGKTHKSTSKYVGEIHNKQVQKEYVCRVIGEFPEGETKCDQPIDVISHKLGLRKVSPNGKTSQTTFQRLSYNGTTSVVRCIPHTGRTHQIRVHLQYLGHPIVNDPFYNSEAFGPYKGKGGTFDRSDSEIAEDILKVHNVGLWVKGENPLYSKRMEEIKAESTQMEATTLLDNKRETTPPGLDAVEQDDISEVHVAKKQKLDIESENNLDANDTSANERESFKNRSSCERPGFDINKWIPDENCESCKTSYIDPERKDLEMYLHALSYKGSDWEYTTSLPEWAKEDWTEDQG